MKNEQQHTIFFSMEEVIQATHDKTIRAHLKERIASSTPKEEALKGVKEFLENHNFDFDKLANFLASSEMDIEKRAAEIRTKKKTNNISYLLASIAAIILVIGGVISLFMHQSKSHEILYTKYYKKEIGLPVIMGDSPSMNDSKIFYESMNLYKDEQYEQAMKGFKLLYELNAHNDTLNYFIGVTYLELDEPKSAILFLNQEFNTINFQQKADFYLALAHLKTGNIEKCSSILKAILNDSKHSYSEQAKDLLTDISNL